MPAAIEPVPGPSLRARARRSLEEAWRRAEQAGDLPRPATPADVAVEIERPANPAHGDLACSLGLKLARTYRRPPLEIARAIAAHVATTADDAASPIGSVEVAPPGFVNLRLSDRALATTIGRILAEPAGWGRSPAAAVPERVNVEFVSANPTGPLHIGNARGAFTGDLLARVLSAAGLQVEREYYFNDFGSQVQNLGASVLALRRGGAIPEDGYHGEYVLELARELPEDVLAASAATGENPAWAVGRWASEQVRSGIERSLEHLGVHFDVWRSESTLHTEGWVEKAVDRLRAAGDVFEADGAVWFRSTRYGDDKDRVVFRSEGGAPTYFAADVGYLFEKFSRGYDRVVFIWGEDHHGYVPRVKAAAEAMGFERDRVQMILTAWVRFIRDGQEIAMSKRTGEFITLDELLAEIGVDAARWFFASRGASSGIDFDIELAKKQSNENPVYYVQYAHARLASILRRAAEAGLVVPAADDPRLDELLLGALPGPFEAQLAREIARLPEVIEDAAASAETQSVTAYATEVATVFHTLYARPENRVVAPEMPERSAARLAVVKATMTTLANALGLLGISAPESM